MNNTLPVTEIYPSIQGEGHYTGTPMTFIRLKGCNLNCPFCDEPEVRGYTDTTAEDIVLQVKHYKNSIVCITGGEPTIHDHLGDLINALQNHGFRVHIETNGILPVPKTHKPVWITVSPKTIVPATQADEIKVVIGPEGHMGHKGLMNTNILDKYPNVAFKYFMPLDPMEVTDYLSDIQGSLNTCLKLQRQYPDWGISLQTHKIMGVE